MAYFSIRVEGLSRFQTPGFTAVQMRSVGETAELAIRERLRLGLNLSDAPAKPLTKRYARYKQRVQRLSSPALRNLRLTGKTLANLQVVSATDNRVVIGFPNPDAARRAGLQHQFDPMFGLSPHDRAVTLDKLNDALETNVRKLAVPK